MQDKQYPVYYSASNTNWESVFTGYARQMPSPTSWSGSWQINPPVEITEYLFDVAEVERMGMMALEFLKGSNGHMESCDQEGGCLCLQIHRLLILDLEEMARQEGAGER